MAPSESLSAQEAARATATSGDCRYIALTTYRRDGRPVTTPVWAVPLGARSTLSLRTAPARRGACAPRVGYASPRVMPTVATSWVSGRRAPDASFLTKRARERPWRYRLRGFYGERVVLELTPSPKPEQTTRFTN